jgi:hypothetical protein
MLEDPERFGALLRDFVGERQLLAEPPDDAGDADRDGDDRDG